MKKLLLLALSGLFLATPAVANNLQVAVTGVSGTSGAPSYTALLTNVSWDNSWRDGENWDGVWLFMKYRQRGTAEWHPATLATADAAHAVPAGAALSAATDGRGVMLYRAADGTGSFAAPGVALAWNHLADGIGLASGYDVQVYGVEMVYVPAGPLALNAVPQAMLSNEFVSVGGSLSQITSEAPLPAGALRWSDETGGGGNGNPITVGGVVYQGSDALGANYPKGTAAAYCMKYEISQGQYTDFLNSLARPQQNRRVAADISGDSPVGGNVYVMGPAATALAASRNTITCAASGLGTTAPVVFACARPDRAANSLVWADGAAYLDWAGLRPMSELEYEKICRGPRPVVAGEGGWGSAVTTPATTISGPENGTETTNAGANSVFDNVTFTGGDGGQGPLRVGVFARATTTREQSGASYYGVMEMSGNCWERCITVAGFDTGLPTLAGQFDGTRHGDGRLDATGDHNVTTWPNSTDVRGSNFRGGNWSRPREWAAVSDRIYGGQAIAGRTAHRSIRGVRSGSSLNPFMSPTGGGTTTPAKFYGGSYDGYASSGAYLVVLGTTAGAAAVRATIAPNPFHEIATLHLSSGRLLTDATLTWHDALGRPVRRADHLRGATLPLNGAGLPGGLYWLEVREAGTLVLPVTKVVLQ